MFNIYFELFPQKNKNLIRLVKLYKWLPVNQYEAER